MTTFAPDRFEAYCARFVPAFRVEALACATVTPTAISLPEECLRSLRARYTPLPRPPGLGDRVAAVAQPIARALDRVLGTDIQHCGGCQRRREALNRLGEKLS